MEREEFDVDPHDDISAEDEELAACGDDPLKLHALARKLIASRKRHHGEMSAV
jgi:hypothetical protein